MTWKQTKKTRDSAGDIARMTFFLYESDEAGDSLITVGVVRRAELPRGPRIKVSALMRGEEIFIPEDVLPDILREVEAIQKDDWSV